MGQFESSIESYEFDRATALRSDDRAVFHGDVAPGWDILGNANGGYLLAIVGRALSIATGRADCITVTAHYLAPCPAGPIRVEVSPVRAGRRFATATASMVQVDSGKEALRVVATLGDLATDPGGPTAMQDSRPDIVDFDDAWRVSETSINSFAFIHDRLATRADPRDIGFREGRPSGEGLVRGWFDFRDGRPIDSLALLLAADAFPPAVFNLALPTSWVPTVEMTVHVRAIPAPGPVACFFRTRFVQNGLLEEDGEMWDSAGTLVAQSRQLALAPRA